MSDDARRNRDPLAGVQRFNRSDECLNQHGFESMYAAAEGTWMRANDAIQAVAALCLENDKLSEELGALSRRHRAYADGIAKAIGSDRAEIAAMKGRG